MDIKLIESRLRFSLYLTAGIAVLAVLAYIIWFFGVIDLPASEEASTWGEFGDFIGGVMNPLVAACALYWLTMSVRLQKEELAAARSELELTRNELAAGSAAQQKQARLALLSTQISSLNIRLGSITGELEHLRNRLTYVFQRMDEKGPHFKINHLAKGPSTPAYVLGTHLEERMSFLNENEVKILEELDGINDLIKKELS